MTGKGGEPVSSVYKDGCKGLVWLCLISPGMTLSAYDTQNASMTSNQVFSCMNG